MARGGGGNEFRCPGQVFPRLSGARRVLRAIRDLKNYSVWSHIMNKLPDMMPDFMAKAVKNEALGSFFDSHVQGAAVVEDSHINLKNGRIRLVVVRGIYFL